LVRIDLPDGTIQRTDFGIWQTVTWDPGDTVLEGRWHTDRKNRLIDAELLARGCDPAREAAAAVQAEAYAGTPTTALLDPLGRPVLGLSHAGFDAGGKALLFQTTLLLDVAGNVLQVLDARGNTPIAFDYDMVGRRVVQHSMDGGVRSTLPTVTNLPLLRWDQRNHALTYQYDALQRQTGLHVAGGDDAAPLDSQVMHAVYGEGQPNDRLQGLRGRLYRRWDTAGRLEWSSFDGKGNLLIGTRRFAGNYRVLVNWSADLEAPLEAEAHTTTYTYDAVNRLIDTTLPDGSRTTRAYTPANLLGRIDAQSPGGAVETIIAAIAYDARGRRATIDHGNGAHTEYRYDPDSLRLIGLLTRKADGSVVQDLAYTHDCGGNLTDLEDRALPAVFFDNNKIDALSHFTYDPLYRLIGAQGREHAGQQASFGPQDDWDDSNFIVHHQPGDVMAWRGYTQTYRWDAVGNLRNLAHAAGAGSYTRAYTYEAATNRLTATAIGADVYAYDHHPAHGFIRQMPQLPVMRYDFLDRMCASSRQSVAAGTPETTWYIYDHDGKRLRKVTDRAAAAGAVPQMKEDRRYLGALEIFRSQTGATTGLQRTTLHIMDNMRRFAMIDQRNAVDDGTPARVVRYQFSNHLGSASLELDAAGRALAYEEYHPFGTTSYQATDSTLQVATRRYRYCGLERDEESGLAMHGARYYAPWLGRWTEPDPTGLADGIDDYAYCSANPLRMTDPGGCDGWDRFFGGLKMVGGALETVGGGALFLGGCAASELGVGVPVAVAGGAVTLHGVDVTVSGFRTMWNGEQVDTVTSQELQEHTSLTRSQANMFDAGISIVGSLGAGAVTRAPAVASGLRGAAAADDVAANSITLAFKPGVPVGHNIVGITSEGTTTWSHLVVDELAQSGGTGVRYVAPGTGASVVESTAGPSASYLTVTVPRTAAQVEAAQQAVTLGKAGTYSYLTNNCTTYATSVVRASGLTAPATTPMASFVTTALQSPNVVQPVVAASVVTNATVGVYSGAQPDTPPASSSVEIGPDPSVVSSPAISTPADVTPAPVHSTPVSSSMDDPGAQVCAAEGYYNDVEQVCYSQ
jgi:RHS repeat-associated protein